MHENAGKLLFIIAVCGLLRGCDTFNNLPLFQSTHPVPWQKCIRDHLSQKHRAGTNADVATQPRHGMQSASGAFGQLVVSTADLALRCEDNRENASEESEEKAESADARERDQRNSQSDDRNLLPSDLSDLGDVDLPILQNDVSILCMYSLFNSIVEDAATGVKQQFGWTMRDVEELGRYFTDAASLGIAWAVAGTITSLFKQEKGWAFEVTARDIQRIFITWLIAAPLSEAIRIAGGGDFSGLQGVRDTLAMLGLMVLWRFVEPYFYL